MVQATTAPRLILAHAKNATAPARLPQLRRNGNETQPSRRLDWDAESDWSFHLCGNRAYRYHRRRGVAGTLPPSTPELDLTMNEKLIPALRQFKHNDDSEGFVSAYDMAIVDREFAALEARAERFFIDHTMWHDRETGQHMYTEDEFYEKYRDGLAIGRESAECASYPLLQALRTIASSVPACDASGGFFFEHHDQDGEFLGVEQVNPADIIQVIDGLAHDAIAAFEHGAIPIQAPASPVVVRKPLQRCAAGRDGDCTHPDCPQLRDNEPKATGRHCPLDTSDEDD